MVFATGTGCSFPGQLGCSHRLLMWTRSVVVISRTRRVVWLVGVVWLLVQCYGVMGYGGARAYAG
jgi:hypothetical protein